MTLNGYKERNDVTKEFGEQKKTTVKIVNPLNITEIKAPAIEL